MTFWTKSILSLPLAVLVFLGFFSALELLGRKEKRFRPQHLRGFHKINGCAFLVLSLILSYYCVKIMRGAGQELSARAALHGFMALGVYLFLGFKIVIVRVYRQYYSLVPALGMTVAMLAMGTIASSAGYYFALRGGSPPPPVAGGVLQGMRTEGARIFQRKCADCHHADRKDTKIGPGLLGLFKAETFPVSGRPATEENFRRQMEDPVNVMPAFKDLAEGEMKALIAFIKSL